MGVPGFFKWLWDKYKKTNFVFQKSDKLDDSLQEHINTIDYLLIDANCLIHPTCFKVLAENPDFTNQASLENKMMNASIDYIEKLIQYVDPKVGVYLAIDGVAPAAKIKQQRSRRFKSVHDRELWDNIKKKHDKPVGKFWNNSAITPGTEFMERLHYKILSWAKNRKGIKVIYSSCKTPSEGEHKLLQFIRTNIKNNIKHKYVMYGLDADLIFLCLATNSDNMFLLREANQMDKGKSKDSFNYVSIDIMKELVIDTIDGIAKKDSDVTGRLIDKKYGENIINDFIFLCYLLGNDFLPHIPALNIYTDGLDILIDKYIELLSVNNYQSFIINRTKNGVTVDTTLFRELLSYLGSEESEILKNEHLTKRRYYKSRSSDPYDIEVHRIDNLQFKVKDPIMLGSDDSDKWKVRYYKHHFNTNKNEIEEFSNKLVEEYLRGLVWVAKYYFDKCPSWNWFYPFDYPPFLEDIDRYLNDNKKFDFNKVKFDYGAPLKPFNQLLLVLPPQSSYLIPKELNKIVHNPNSTLAYMYPTVIKQDFIGKFKHWMAIPQLPAIDLDLVKKIYLKYEKKIPSKTLNRNKRLDIFNFN